MLITQSHAAMMPADIKEFFVSVFKQAQVLKEAYDKEKRKKIKIPFVTVSVLYNDNVLGRHGSASLCTVLPA